MISLELWRAKIGMFNCSRPPSSSLLSSLHHHQQSVAHGWFLAGGGSAGLFSSLCRSLLIRRALALLLVAVITHLLLSAGDVEQNPGPGTVADDNTAVYEVFREHFDQLLRAMRPSQTALITVLFSKGLINNADRSNLLTLSNKDRAIGLLTAVETKMKVEPRAARVVREFCEAVRNDHPAMRHVADRITTALDQPILSTQSSSASNSDDSAESILAKALKLGVVKMKITKLLISGAAATGKSSLIAMLLGNPPVLKHDSTLLSRPLRHARFTAEGDSSLKWECVDNPVDLEELLAGGIKDLAANGPTRQSRQSLLSGPIEGADYNMSSEPSYSNEDAAYYNKSETFASLVPRVQSAVESKCLEAIHWIYTIDSGGQPAFLDVLPAFIRGNSVAIHTLKLDQHLDDRIKMVFSIDGKKCDSEDLCMTSLQLIKTLVRSSSSSHFLADSANKTKPHCIIVGTFYDKIGKSTDNLKVIDRQLQDNLQYSDDVLVPFGDGIIFPVDTTVQGEEREEMASELREMITDGTSMEKKIPVKWFTYELELRKRRSAQLQGILSMDECVLVGDLFEMNGTEVKKCIKYLHEQTLLLYFEEPLPNTVFIHSQTILDKVSAIIFVSLLNYNTRQLRPAVRKLPNAESDVKNLRKQGKFDRKLLDYLPDVLSCILSKEQSVLFPDVFTADDFLTLLEHLLVIAKLPEEGQYFIPCVLPTETSLEQQKRNFSKNADPLCICWEEMPIPLGLFPALVVQLMQRENGQEFPLSKRQQHFRNAIYLDCPSLGGAILLVDSIDWMEVYYSGEKSQCLKIRQAIIDGISTVVNTFGYQEKLCDPRQGFCCQILQECLTHKHLCLVPIGQDQPTIVTCPTTSQVQDCSPRQLCWFETTTAGAAGRTVQMDSSVNMRADHISSGGVGNVLGDVHQYHYYNYQK